MKQSNVVQFSPNIPQQIALEFSEGKPVDGKYGPQVLFSLADGRVMFVTPELARSIMNLEVKPGEAFSICRYWNGARGRGSITRWNVWLDPKTEQERATAEQQADLNPVAEPLEARTRTFVPKLVEMPGPAVALAPTGTDGPSPAPALRKPLAGKIPFNVAFSEAVKIVKDGLQANGEVWNDEAREAIVATILIAGSQQGWVGVWERPAA
jgi:hypothetical protein